MPVRSADEGIKGKTGKLAVPRKRVCDNPPRAVEGFPLRSERPQQVKQLSSDRSAQEHVSLRRQIFLRDRRSNRGLTSSKQARKAD